MSGKEDGSSSGGQICASRQKGWPDQRGTRSGDYEIVEKSAPYPTLRRLWRRQERDLPFARAVSYIDFFFKDKDRGSSANSWTWCLFSFAFFPRKKHRRGRTLWAGDWRRFRPDWKSLCHLYAPNMRGYPVHPPSTRPTSRHEGRSFLCEIVHFNIRL